MLGPEVPNNLAGACLTSLISCPTATPAFFQFLECPDSFAQQELCMCFSLYLELFPLHPSFGHRLSHLSTNVTV